MTTSIDLSSNSLSLSITDSDNIVHKRSFVIDNRKLRELVRDGGIDKLLDVGGLIKKYDDLAEKLMSKKKSDAPFNDLVDFIVELVDTVSNHTDNYPTRDFILHLLFPESNKDSMSIRAIFLFCVESIKKPLIGALSWETEVRTLIRTEQLDHLISTSSCLPPSVQESL